jgi:endonuclease YncB( thermonuclease family)
MGALPPSWDGQAFAIDGHTLGAVGLKPQIRIWGIQGPELRDAASIERVAGMRARAALEDLLEQAGLSLPRVATSPSIRLRPH